VSWFDRVGDVFDSIKNTAIPAVGGALASAASGTHDFFYNTPVLGDVSRALDPVQGLVEHVTGTSANAVGTGFSYAAARPVSTFAQVTGEDTAHKEFGPVAPSASLLTRRTGVRPGAPPRISPRVRPSSLARALPPRA
jgi:hypothetical protein